MSKAKAISDEQIIAALLNYKTIKEAAAAVGLSERAIYDRMNAGSFKTLYLNAKADIMRSAVISLNENITAAVQTIADVMNDKNNNPAIRLQAAQTLLNNAAKFTQRLTEQEAGIDMHIQCERLTGAFRNIDE